jgi:hypothetical protein
LLTKVMSTCRNDIEETISRTNHCR